MKQYILLSKIVHISASASKYLFLLTFERCRGFGPQMHERNTKNASHGEKRNIPWLVAKPFTYSNSNQNLRRTLYTFESHQNQ